jgi:hypothetical protein
MNPIFKKLQLNVLTKEILVLNAPDEFEHTLQEVSETVTVSRGATQAKYDFILTFVKSCKEVESHAETITNLLAEDGNLWFAYPKKSSKKYKSDLGRDDSWSALGSLDFEPVRQIAIDEDWSALRFRKASLIKKFTRKTALSDTGKSRIEE